MAGFCPDLHQLRRKMERIAVVTVSTVFEGS